MHLRESALAESSIRERNLFQLIIHPVASNTKGYTPSPVGRAGDPNATAALWGGRKVIEVGCCGGGGCCGSTGAAAAEAGGGGACAGEPPPRAARMLSFRSSNALLGALAGVPKRGTSSASEVVTTTSATAGTPPPPKSTAKGLGSAGETGANPSSVHKDQRPEPT